MFYKQQNLLEKAQTILPKLKLSEDSLSSNSASLNWKEEWLSLEIFFPMQTLVSYFLPSLWLWPVLLICKESHVGNF